MKTFTLSALALVLTLGTASAHDIHNQASDHTHPQNLYTHSVSSHVNHHDVHHYNGQYNYHQGSHKKAQPTSYLAPTTTKTYYTRQYPVKRNYTYYRPANTTIHQPPYAYSSCAGRCDQAPKRMMVSSTVGHRSHTYRAPSEYKASCSLKQLPTPRKVTNGCRQNHGYHYTSPVTTHKVSTCGSCGGCSY